MIALIIFVGFSIFSCIYLYKLAKTKPKNFPPGPPNLPIWGSYWFLLMANYNFTHKAIDVLAKRYKSDVVGMIFGNAPVVNVTGYHLVKEALTRDEFSGRCDIYVNRCRSMGKILGIFFKDGDYWKEQRRFALRQLRDFGFGRRFPITEQLLEGEVKDLIESISSVPRTDDYDVQQKKGRVLIPDLFYGPLSNAVLHMLVGKRFENNKLRAIARSTLRFLRNVDTTGRILNMFPWVRHFGSEYFGFKPLIEENKRIRDFFLDLVEERKKTFSNDHHGDFLDTFIGKIQQLQSEGAPLGTFTEDQLIWSMIDFFFPSPNAIGPALNMLFAHLCNYPEVQVKLQAEIGRVVGRSRLPNLDDRNNMPYTEAVIRESLRMDPIIPVNTPRRCLQDTILGGYTIPKNTTLLISQWNANRDERVWKDPNVFNPERFLDSNRNLMKVDNTLSFGAGKRLCAGETFARQTIFLILTGLLQNFTFEPVGGAPDLDGKKWGFVCDLPAFWVDAISR